MPDPDTDRDPQAERIAWLHVGLHKTGTTHIQRTLRELRPQLADAGLSTPDLGPNPGWPLIYWLDGEDAAPRSAGDPGRAAFARPEARARAGAAIEAALADRAARTLLLSAEQLSTKLDADGIARFLDRLRAAGWTPRAVAYLRRPEEHAAAMVQQVTLAGAPLADALARPPLPRWRRRLRPWLAALGQEAVVLRVYDRARLVDGDAFADLMHAIARPELAALAPRGAGANPRLSAAGLRLLDWRNRALAALHPGWERRRPVLLHLLARALPGAPLTLPPETLAEIRRASRRDLRWAERRLGRPPFPDPPAPPGGG